MSTKGERAEEQVRRKVVKGRRTKKKKQNSSGPIVEPWSTTVGCRESKGV